MKSKEAASLGSVPLLITEIVFLTLAVVAVLFRFLSHLCVKNSLGLDDFGLSLPWFSFGCIRAYNWGVSQCSSHQWPLTDPILGLSIVRSPYPDMSFWTKVRTLVRCVSRAYICSWNTSVHYFVTRRHSV